MSYVCFTCSNFKQTSDKKYKIAIKLIKIVIIIRVIRI